MNQADNELLLLLSQVEPAKRVLLVSHCLRPSQSCPGKFSKKGLVCPDGCGLGCAIRHFREAAASMGYAGVCVAAGGAMAVRFVKEHRPEGIIAVACSKELGEGIAAVEGLAEAADKVPLIVSIPLLTDGCVDTEVDETLVLQAIKSVRANGGIPVSSILPAAAVQFPLLSPPAKAGGLPIESRELEKS